MNPYSNIKIYSFIALALVLSILSIGIFTASSESDAWQKIYQVSFFLSDGKTFIKVSNLPGKDFIHFVDRFEDEDFELITGLDQETNIACTVNANYNEHMAIKTKIVCNNTAIFANSRAEVINASKDYVEEVVKATSQSIAEVIEK